MVKARVSPGLVYKVFKYNIDLKDILEIEMPFGSDVLEFKQQDGDMFIWAMVNIGEKEIVTKKFRLCGSGKDVMDGVQMGQSVHFIGSTFLNRNQLVFHLFEIKG